MTSPIRDEWRSPCIDGCGTSRRVDLAESLHLVEAWLQDATRPGPVSVAVPGLPVQFVAWDPDGCETLAERVASQPWHGWEDDEGEETDERGTV